MSWRAITEADITTRMSGVELSVFRSSVLADGQADPIADAMAQVTAQVRGAVAVRYQLGDSGTIPESLLGAALDILVIDIMTRAGGTVIDPNDARRTKASEARRLLERVAEGKHTVEDATGTGQQGMGGARRVTTNTPRVTRDNLKGL